MSKRLIVNKNYKYPITMAFTMSPFRIVFALILVILGFSTAHSQDEVVEIPDPVFKEVLLLKNNLDANGDGLLQTSEALTLTTLSFDGVSGVTDLTGIRALKNLTNISMYSSFSPSTIEMLDLSGMEKLEECLLTGQGFYSILLNGCSRLKTLGFGSSVDHIEFYKCTSLTSINSKSPSIALLDTRELPALQQIDFYTASGIRKILFNEITPTLQKLSIYSGPIDYIDLSKQTKLESFSAPYIKATCISAPSIAFTGTSWSIPPGASLSEKCPNADITVYFQDEYLKKYLIGSLGVDTDNNGEIEYDEALAYTKDIELNGLHVDIAKITSLIGLDAFANVSTITIDGISGLTKIDMAAFTSLGALKVLNCENVLRINTGRLSKLTYLSCQFNKSLVSLNVRQCPELIELECSESPLLKNVDISTNTALRVLSMANCGLTSIDLSNNTALEKVYLDGNKLTAVNFDKNSNLLHCSIRNNSIAQLDFSNNPQLATVNCQHNGLTTLNIKTGTLSISTLYAATGNPGLNCVIVDDEIYANQYYSNNNIGLIFSEDCDETVPFSDDNFGQYMASIADINGDKKVQLWEASQYSGAIILDGRYNESIDKITSLGGIEYFSGITGLQINFVRGITQLALSKNTNLAFVSLQTTSITTIEAEGLKSLTSFSSISSLISSLNLKGCTNLETLTLNAEKVTEFDFGLFPKLSSISVSHTPLNAINLSNNTVLTKVYADGVPTTCIEVNDPATFLESLTFYTFDPEDRFVKECSIIEIPDQGFKQFLLEELALDFNSDGELQNTEAMNFRGKMLFDTDIRINDLSGIEYFPGISAIVIPQKIGDAFTSLNLMSMDSLEIIDISYQKIDALFINNCPRLRKLRLSFASVAQLSVDNCGKLNNISIANTSIPLFDVNSYPALDSLVLFNTGLKEIIFDENSPQLRRLHVNTNMLESLDISLQLALQDFNATDNALTCIAVSDVEFANNTWLNSIDPEVSFAAKCLNADEDVIFEDVLLQDYIIERIPEIDENNDGIVQKTEARAYTKSITISSDEWSRVKNVSSLVGLHEFINVDEFIFTGLNIVDTITLSMFSSASTIQIENCGSITTINAENYTELINLSIQNLSRLTNVTTQNSLELQSLTIDDCPLISSVDLAANSNLDSLFIQNTAIESLDLTSNVLLKKVVLAANPNLSCVTVNSAEYAEATFSEDNPTVIFSEICGEQHIVAFEDDALKHYFIALGADVNGNGEITDLEAAYFKTSQLILPDSITSFVGIKAFTGITSIVIEGNFDNMEYDALDVSSMNNLQHIAIGHNTTLKSLNISGCPSLTYLILDSTFIRTITTDNENVSLKYLSIRKSADNNIGTTIRAFSGIELLIIDELPDQLTSLDLSANSTLTGITINNTDLQEIDLRNLPLLAQVSFSGNEQLICVAVDSVQYAQTITAENSDSFQYKTDCSIEEVRIADENLRTYLLEQTDADANYDGIISVSEANQYSGAIVLDERYPVTNLSGIDAFTSIHLFEVNGSPDLSAVDLSANISLSSITINNTGVVSLQIAELPIDTVIITNNPYLENIDVSTNTALQCLDVRSNALSMLNVANNVNLTELRVDSNNISELNLQKNNNLTTFSSIGNNNLFRIVVSDVAYFVQNANPQIDSFTVIEDQNHTPDPIKVEFNIEACGGYVFDGKEFSHSTIYTNTYVAANGADSTVILNLTIHQLSDTTIHRSIYSGETFLFGSRIIHTAGLYADTVTSVHGCDSIVYLNLSVEYKTVEFTILREEAYGEFEYRNRMLTKSGNYKDTLKNIAGQDSIVILVLKIMPTKIIAMEEYILPGKTFSIQNKELSEEGTYRFRFPQETGRDSIIILTLTALEANQIVHVQEVVSCDSYIHNGMVVTQSAQLKDTLQTKDGADSISVINLTVHYSEQVDKQAIIYRGEKYPFGNTSLYEPNEYIHTFTNQYGCDSTVQLSLYVIEQEEIITKVAVEACGEYVSNGKRLVSSGQYMDKFETNNGLDSVVILDLTINNEYVTVKEDFAFYGEEYLFYDSLLTQSGVYTKTFEAESGCDSTEELRLTVLPEKIVYNIEIAEVCNSYTFFGRECSQSGNYLDTISYGGIDTIYILKLTVGNPFQIVREGIIKPGETLIFGDDTLSQAGEYIKTFISAQGCDSIVTLVLTAVDEETIVTNSKEQTCGNYIFNSDTLTQTGAYKAMHIAQDGNDSIVLLDLIVYPEYMQRIYDTIDRGSSLVFGNQELIADGAYTQHLYTTQGCDSIVELNLHINNNVPKYQEFSYSVCGAYNFNGTYYYESGTYTQSFKTSYGADSVVKVHLTVNHGEEVSVRDYFVVGNTYTFGSLQITQPGEYTQVFRTAHSCDSTVHLVLEELSGESIVLVVYDTTCGSYNFYGQELTESGRYTHLSQSDTVADTLTELNLTVINGYYQTVNEYLYKGETYTLGDMVIGQSGAYSHTFVTSRGCDSVIDLYITFLDEGSVINKIQETVCGEFYYNDDLKTHSGIYEFYEKTLDGADSLVIIDLTVNEEYHEKVEGIIYQGGVFSFGGVDYSESGEYIISGKTAKGCDSTIVVVLKVRTSDTIITVQACESYEMNGQMYRESGYYENTIKTTSNADSTIYLDLTILKASYFAIDTTIIEGQEFNFNGKTYAESASDTVWLEAANGCDSIVTVYVSMLPKNTTPDTIITFMGCQPAQYNGNILRETGEYLYVFENSYGNDSIVLVKVEQTSIEFDVFDTITYGSSLRFENAEYIYDTVVSRMFTSVNGCDSIVTLHLTVLNTAPQFTDETERLEIIIYDDAVEGTEILLLDAEDKEGNKLTYSLVGKSSVFSVHPQTGSVTIYNTTNLNYQTQQSYSLTIKVSDGKDYDNIVVEVTVKSKNMSDIQPAGNSIKIFPTSVESQLYIQSSAENAIVSVMSASGANLMKETFSKNVILSLKELKKGSYVIVVKTKEGEYYQTIVKE